MPRCFSISTPFSLPFFFLSSRLSRFRFFPRFLSFSFSSPLFSSPSPLLFSRQLSRLSSVVFQGHLGAFSTVEAILCCLLRPSSVVSCPASRFCPAGSLRLFALRARRQELRRQIRSTHFLVSQSVSPLTLFPPSPPFLLFFPSPAKLCSMKYLTVCDSSSTW